MRFQVTFSTVTDSGEWATVGSVSTDARGRSDSIMLCDMIEQTTLGLARRLARGSLDSEAMPIGTVWRFAATSEAYANVARLYAYGIIERRDDGAVIGRTMRAYRHIPWAVNPRARINLPLYARTAGFPVNAETLTSRTSAEKRDSALASAVNACRTHLAKYIPRFDSI